MTFNSKDNVKLSVSDLEIGAVEIKNSASDVRALLSAANTVRAATDVVLSVQNLDATGAVLSTGSLALEAGGNLAACATALQIIDDWDETNRCAVNIIAGQVGVAAGSGAVDALTQRVILATDDPAVTLLGTIDSDTNAIKTAVEVMDDWDATHDSAVVTSGPQSILDARSAQATAVASGDAVRAVANLYGEQAIAGHTWATNSNRMEEVDPLDQKYVSETPLDLEDIATNTTGYGYIDMAGFRYITIQGETSGAAPTDTLTVTLEATVQDDGTAAASCAYQDVTNTLAGVVSWVDTDFMVIVDVPVALKYLRIKYVTSNDAGGDADLTVYTKKMF